MGSPLFSTNQATQIFSFSPGSQFQPSPKMFPSARRRKKRKSAQPTHTKFFAGVQLPARDSELGCSKVSRSRTTFGARTMIDLIGWLVGCLLACLLACLLGCLVAWLLGCLVAWLLGCLVAWLVGWLVGSCLVAWLLGWLVGWLVVGWLVGWLVGCLVAWLLGCLFAWLLGCLVAWLI